MYPLQKKINALRELQSATGEELRPLFGRTLISCPKGIVIYRGAHMKLFYLSWLLGILSYYFQVEIRMEMDKTFTGEL